MEGFEKRRGEVRGVGAGGEREGDGGALGAEEDGGDGGVVGEGFAPPATRDRVSVVLGWGMGVEVEGGGLVDCSCVVVFAFEGWGDVRVDPEGPEGVVEVEDD